MVGGSPPPPPRHHHHHHHHHLRSGCGTRCSRSEGHGHLYGGMPPHPRYGTGGTPSGADRCCPAGRSLKAMAASASSCPLWWDRFPAAALAGWPFQPQGCTARRYMHSCRRRNPVVIMMVMWWDPPSHTDRIRGSFPNTHALPCTHKFKKERWQQKR